MTRAEWWWYWSGVSAAVLTALAALAGVVAWYFGLQVSRADAQRARMMQLQIAEQQERAANAEKALFDLQERARPRSITPAQREALLRLLRSASSKGPVEVSSPTGDGEALNYANEFRDILRDAGWPLANERIFAELVTGVGVHVVVRDPAAPPVTADHLRNALMEAGIQTEESSQPDNVPVGTIRLAVKSKPQ